MKIVFLATICAMAASFLFSLLVVQVSTFEALTDPNDLIDQLKGNKAVTDIRVDEVMESPKLAE